MRYVTVAMLKRLDACEEQIQEFEETFGQKAFISKKNYLKALEIGLDVSFLWRHSPDFKKALGPIQVKVHHKEFEERFQALKSAVEGSKLSSKKKKEVIKLLARERDEGNLRNGDFGTAFWWRGTPEGWKFWDSVYKQIR